MEMNGVLMHFLEAGFWFVIAGACAWLYPFTVRRQKDRTRAYLFDHPECWAKLSKFQRWYNDLHPTKNEFL